MAQRRPLVIAGGQIGELPAGDSLAGDLAFASVVIEGGGEAIGTGIAGDLGPFPFACEIEEASALADQTGSIVVDIWRDSYANFPPTDADSITASAPITISDDTKAQDATLTGWSKAIAAGDVLRFNVDSVTAIERLTLTLKLRKT